MKGEIMRIRSLDDYGIYESARNRSLESTQGMGTNTVAYNSRIGTFDNATQFDWKILEPLIAGINSLYAPIPDRPVDDGNYVRPSTYGQIARIEFIHSWTGNIERRGALVFDNRWEALFCAQHALLGYGGSGPELSLNILMASGVPEELFHEANSLVTSHDYDSVVFSREETYIDDGEVRTSINRPVLDHWTWWITS